MAASSLEDPHQQARGQIKRAGLNNAFRKGDFFFLLFFSNTAVVMSHSVKHVGVTLCGTPRCHLCLCWVDFPPTVQTLLRCLVVCYVRGCVTNTTAQLDCGFTYRNVVT